MVRRAVLLAIILVVAAPRSARAETTNEELLVGAFDMAIPAYFLGVAWHEASHALWAKLYGAEILPRLRARHG